MRQNIRCHWCGDDQLYIKYHDEEWGRPVYNDSILFEFLILEGAQAGLSWITILSKRENYRKAFSNFSAKKVALYGVNGIEELMLNEGIIRNRLKINGAVNNAKRFLEVQEQFGSFSNYIWGFLPDGKPVVNNIINDNEVPASTELSDNISKDMKKRGFKFFGSTICYAFMQATGMVNDHLNTCVVK